MIDPQHFGGALAAMLGQGGGFADTSRFERLSGSDPRLRDIASAQGIALDPLQMYSVALDRQGGALQRIIGATGPSQAMIRLTQGTGAQQKAAFSGHGVKAALDILRPAVDPRLPTFNRGATQSAALALAAVETAENFPMTLGNLFGRAGHEAANAGMDPESQVILNNWLELLAAVGFGRGGATLTYSEWSKGARSYLPRPTDSDKAMADKVDRADRFWKGLRGQASEPVWQAMGSSIYGPSAGDIQQAPPEPQQSSRLQGFRAQMDSVLVRLRGKKP
jgi:hypothetical protein